MEQEEGGREVRYFRWLRSSALPAWRIALLVLLAVMAWNSVRTRQLVEAEFSERPELLRSVGNVGPWPATTKELLRDVRETVATWKK